MLSVALALAAAAAQKVESKPMWVPLGQTQSKTKPKESTPVAAAPSQPAPAAPPTAQPAAPLPTNPEQPAVADTTPTAPAATAVQGRLDLTCFGGGTANKPKITTVYGGSNFSGSVGMVGFHGSSSGSATAYGTRQQGFGDQVDVRLFAGDDRIRMPRTMLPGIHGGDHGWFKLKNVVADTRSIRASAAVNVLNNPKVFIDRVTGTISISGKAGDYAGQCQAVDATAPAQF